MTLWKPSPFRGKVTYRDFFERLLVFRFGFLYRRLTVILKSPKLSVTRITVSVTSTYHHLLSYGYNDTQTYLKNQ